MPAPQDPRFLDLRPLSDEELNQVRLLPGRAGYRRCTPDELRRLKQIQRIRARQGQVTTPNDQQVEDWLALTLIIEAADGAALAHVLDYQPSGAGDDWRRLTPAELQQLQRIMQVYRRAPTPVGEDPALIERILLWGEMTLMLEAADPKILQELLPYDDPIALRPGGGFYATDPS